MAGRLSRIVAILKSAPRQILSAYRKGYNSAPAVPPPEDLRNRPDPACGFAAGERFTD